MHDPASYVVVIGAANMDIAGKAGGALVAHDSNLGTVRMSYGGVGRNIAHNLALLGCEVHLVAPFGEDALADELTRGCLDAGIHMEHSFRVNGAATSTYLYIMDADGEMQVAINDMDIVSQITRERIEERLDLIQGAQVCVVDANLEPEVLSWICDHVSVPIFSDPISCAKAPRLQGVIGRLHSLKPNHIEAEFLTGCAEPEDAARKLLETGLERAFVSHGAKGLVCAQGDVVVRLGRAPGTVANATGAGDAMMAGLIWAHLEGMELVDAGRAGLAAAAICIESDQTVSPAMSAAALVERMGGIK